MTNSKMFGTAIILAAVLISAAAAFFGWPLKQSQTVIDEEQLAARIKESVLAEMQSENFMAAQKASLLSALKDQNIKVPRVSKQEHIYGNSAAEISQSSTPISNAPSAKHFIPIRSRLSMLWGKSQLGLSPLPLTIPQSRCPKTGRSI